MNAKIIMSLFMVFAMIGVAIPSAVASGNDCGSNCDVRIPVCHDCYVMTAQANLETGHDGVEVSGTSTAITRDVKTTVDVNIEANGGSTLLEVGSAVDKPSVLSYGTFAVEETRADIDMSSLGVIDGGRDCDAYALTNLEADVHGDASGSTQAVYGETQGEGNHAPTTVNLDAVSIVTGDITNAEGGSDAKSSFTPGSVYAGVEITPTSVASFSGLEFYKSHFGNHED